MSLIGLSTHLQARVHEAGVSHRPHMDRVYTRPHPGSGFEALRDSESAFATTSLGNHENLALRASSLRAIPPPPPEFMPLEGLAGVNLYEANLTQWASYIQDVALGMRKPPKAAMDCPIEDIMGSSTSWRR